MVELLAEFRLEYVRLLTNFVADELRLFPFEIVVEDVVGCAV